MLEGPYYLWYFSLPYVGKITKWKIDLFYPYVVEKKVAKKIFWKY
jgi:hypothetical protein